MRKTLETPPRTIMEVYRSLPEGTLAELIDKVIYMSPSSVYKHQKVVQSIYTQLNHILTTQEKGEAIISPFDVYPDESSNAVQPDIIVVLNENHHIIHENGHIHGVPDMLVEAGKQRP